jgi:hypothetical protein
VPPEPAESTQRCPREVKPGSRRSFAVAACATRKKACFRPFRSLERAFRRTEVLRKQILPLSVRPLRCTVNKRIERARGYARAVSVR